jgi:chemotaxis protein methyltransferase CheR
VRDLECVDFLRWALPRQRLRWEGYRKVRRQVCRRVERRLRELGLSGAGAYRTYLEENPGEWLLLDALCHVTISRFYRDRGTFELLARTVLPDLARRASGRGDAVEAWSAGCASGEEPYSLVLAWEHAIRPSLPDVSLHVLASDADGTMVERAKAASYEESSLRELPASWLRTGFTRRGGRYHLRPRFRRPVTVVVHDVRERPPAGSYDLVLCRNLAFTYFDAALQLEVAGSLHGALGPEGVLVLGSHETLPAGAGGFEPLCAGRGVYRRAPPAPAALSTRQRPS